MCRNLVIAIIGLASISCCGDGEKLLLPPLPQDGAALPYSQVLTRLAAQTNTAKEELFLEKWDGLADAATALDQSASYLLKSPDLPMVHKATFEKSANGLKQDVTKLRDGAKSKDQSQTLEAIRRIHNQVRELQDLK